MEIILSKQENSIIHQSEDIKEVSQTRKNSKDANREVDYISSVTPFYELLKAKNKRLLAILETMLSSIPARINLTSHDSALFQMQRNFKKMRYIALKV